MRNKARYELTKTKYLNDDEHQKLNIILNKFNETNPRDTVLLWMLLHTGARAQELLNIQTSDLDPVEMTVLITGMKGSDNRDIPLPPWLFRKVRALSPAAGAIFPITYVRLWQIWRMYRPGAKKLHCLRHTFAINLYRKTKDLRLLQVALGHKNWNNTMIYAQYQFKTSELRKGILG